jgi:hypothetical protein
MSKKKYFHDLHVYVNNFCRALLNFHKFLRSQGQAPNPEGRKL